MSTTVKFKDFFGRDGHPALTLEDSIRVTGAFAGIHDWDFENQLDETFANLDDWTSDAEGTFSIVSDQLQIIGGGATRYYRTWHSTEVPLSFVASFDVVSGPGQFLFLGERTSGRGFAAWWTDSACGFATVLSDGTFANIVRMPFGVSVPARMQVAVKYSLDSVNEEIRWVQGTMFIDGTPLTGFTKDIGNTQYDWTGYRVGFSAASVNTLLVDNFTISAFHRVVDWTTIDVGDSPASGQSRAVGTTRLARMARFDGTVRVWRPGDRDEDWAVPADRAVQLMDRDNRVDVSTHVRVRGVWYEADYFNDAEGEVHMHRPTLHDNPNLMSKYETFEEAQRVLHDTREKQREVQVAFPPNPTLEPHDRVSYGGSDHRIETIQTEVTVAGPGVLPRSTIAARSYLPLTIEDESAFILAEDGSIITGEDGTLMIPE